MPVGSPQYPVNLDVFAKRCLVVGGGRVAFRKVNGLVDCGANVHVIAIRVDDEIKAAGVSYEERAYRAGDVDGFRLVITATDRPAINRQVFEDGESAGVWVNAADDPDSCSFTLPAVIRRGLLMLTVSTGGHSPALASWLKTRLGHEIGPEYEQLLQILSQARAELKAEGRSTEEIDWHGALAAGMVESLQREDSQAAQAILREFLT